ncbi:MAG: TolC family protein [Proteobacteria bacterium]|nr:TolC family protein [Pseudomonadota bacterium]
MRAIFCAVAGLLLGLAASAVQAQDDGPLGATVDRLLAAGRDLSPDLRARALEVTAAAARADAAGALGDPMFRVMSDEVDRTAGARINKTYLAVEQEFPLWGKRDLRQSAALAAVDAARGQERAAAAELDERIKSAFARYYAASQALAVNADVARVARQMARTATARYGQGVGPQRDAIGAEAEAIRAEADAAKLDAERLSAMARLNALIARPADTPLVPPRALRPLPGGAPSVDDLLGRARVGNPRLFGTRAELRGAEAERRLAERAWYPDVTLGAGAIQRDNGPAGYTATIGVKIPLQWGVKQAGEREAVAKLGVAQQRIAQLEAEIQGELGVALASLTAARRVGDLTRDRLVPQLDAAYRSALADYGRARGDLAAVLEAEHRLHDARIELLRIETDGQVALAAIERLIGGAL